MRIEKSIMIAAPANHVWPFLVDPEKIKQWCITFQQFEYTGEQRSGVGTPIFIEEKAAGPVMKLDFKVTEWVENETINLKKVAGSMPKEYQQRWHIQPHNGNSTFTFSEEIVMPWGFIGKLLENVAQGSSEKTVDKMLQILKDKVEQH